MPLPKHGLNVELSMLRPWILARFGKACLLPEPGTMFEYPELWLGYML
jgi:hypothetical protein